MSICCLYSMSSSNVTLDVHHHGDFTSGPNLKYIGGRVEENRDFDTDLLCFRDFDDFAKKCEYDLNCIVCYKTIGLNFRQGLGLCMMIVLLGR